jgi:hypothetical protein
MYRTHLKSRCSQRVLAIVSLVGITFLTGCQNWQSSAGLPGLDKWKDERGIVKRASNDPFPSPQQVGLK